MSHRSPGSSLKYIMALTLTSCLAIAEPLPTFAGKSHGFNITVQDASAAIREFGKQSGVQIMVSGDLLRGKKLNPVAGEHSTEAALKILLADSGLTHRYVGEKGVVLVAVGAQDFSRTTSYSGPSLEVHLAEVRSEDKGSPVASTATESKSDELLVQDTRIDGLNNKGLLQGGANGAVYHDVITREDIERMGVTSLEELFRRIPQTSSAVTSLQRAESNSGMTFGSSISYSTMGLRGFSSEDTVILINGRSLPRSSSSDGADLSRIPIAAIERVEILPFAGSAIYGSGAVGGAINIIMRKEYVGSDLTLYAGTTTDGGADEQRLNYVDGRTFNQGRTSLTTTFSFQHRDPLTLGDRDYLERALERFGPNSGVVAPSGLPAYEQYIIPALAGTPGVIVLNSPVGDLGIPGAPGARYARVPTGTSPAASLALTPGSFTATAGQISDGGRYGRSNIYEPMDSTSLNAQVEHAFMEDRLSAYGEFTVSYNRRNYTYPQSLSVSLAANNPLNPFRNDPGTGFVGRPVTLYLDAPDAPDSRTTNEYRYKRAVVGLKGKINQHWEWSVDGVYDRNNSTFLGTDPTTNIGNLSNPALYPVLADHGAYPNSLADNAPFLIERRSWSYGDQKEGNARVTGDVFNLPAGPFRMSTTAKYQAWEGTSGNVYVTGGVPGTPFAGTNSRNLWQGTAEFTLPIISAQWQPIPLESLELQGSASYESIQTITGITPNNPQEQRFNRKADSHVIALKFAPTKDFAFRASFSTAFNPPGWGVVNSNSSYSTIPAMFGIFFPPDASRGGRFQEVDFEYGSAGNPNLQPELAKSRNFGLMLTPRFLPGFSMNFDYWSIRKTDAIAYPDLFRAFSERGYTLGVTRAAAPLPGDDPSWLPPIIRLSFQPFNAASIETKGVDVRLSKVLDAGNSGTFMFNANGTFTNDFLQQDSAVDDPRNSINAAGHLKWRGMGSVTWSKNGFATSLTGRYTGHYSTPFTAPSEAYPSANGFDGERIPSSLLWDLQFSYEVPAANSGGWMGLLTDTKWTLGATNLLNEEPAFVTGLSELGNGGSSFYDQNADPRQRVVYLSLRKGF